MIRIGNGIQANTLVLKKAAEAIGDTGVPDVSNRWKSIAYLVAVLVLVLGTSLFGISI